MNWTIPPATENRPVSGDRQGQFPHSGASLPSNSSAPGILTEISVREIRLDKRTALTLIPGAHPNLEVYTLTLGGETIELLPLKNWNQLDHFKWTARGKLPAEPAGLEVTTDHVRLVGETVTLNDPAGCLKLERLFNDWLRFERETLELARKKAHQQATGLAREKSGEAERKLSFRVELDKRGQVHVHCNQGRDTLASIGLTMAGFTSLQQQGLMRKPQKLVTGALHDWVELDGELCSFENGKNDTARLERLLNEKYIPERAAGAGKEVVVFVNSASPTGFDIQFPVMVAGVPDNHRHHLDDHSLGSLQDPDHCGLLHRQIIVKLIPPNLVFKQKTPDGGEQYLGWQPENTVTMTDENGRQKSLPLSQPLNLLRVSAAELTAVFNHPSINRHAKTGQTAAGPERTPAPAGKPISKSEVKAEPTKPRQEPEAKLTEATQATMAEGADSQIHSGATESGSLAAAATMHFAGARAAPAPPTAPVSAAREQPSEGTLAVKLPNLWLRDMLSTSIGRHDWFAFLTYSKMAERFMNSSEGKFGPGACWYISLGEATEIDDPEFKGVFLTEKGSLGCVSRRQMAKFYNGVAFIGTPDSALEGIDVGLLGLGLDDEERVVFILKDDFRKRFGVPEATLAEVLNRLKVHGVVLNSVTETLASHEALQVVWTVPEKQEDPDDPKAFENTRPAE